MFSCLDTSIVSTALVSISLDLGDAQDAPWTILGYLLTYMSEHQSMAIPWLSFCNYAAFENGGNVVMKLLLIMSYETIGFAVGFSKLSDIYGRRNLLAIAWVFFSGFSIWCALAGSMKQL